jgi:cytoskeletal protein CcmA (bactofilin family)
MTLRGRSFPLLPILAALACLAGDRAVAADPPPAAGEGSRVGDTRFAAADKVRIDAEERPIGDVYVAGGEIDTAGTIAGDLVASGGDVRVGGGVAGDAAIAAAETRIRGDVGDDLRWFGGTLDLHGAVGGDAILGGATVTQHPESRVDGMLVAWAGAIRLSGHVAGPVRITGGEVHLAGAFAGDVEVGCDELTLGRDVTIAGDLHYEARNEIQVPEGAVRGEVSFSAAPKDREGIETGIGLLAVVLGFGFKVYLALAAFIAGLLMIVFLRPFVDGAMAQAASGGELIVSFGVGLVSMLVMLMLGLLCLPLLFGLGIWAALAALVYFGGLIGKMIAGAWLLKPLRGWNTHPVLALLLGVLLLLLIGLIPVLGDVVWLFVTVTGMGACLLRIRSSERLGAGTPPQAPPAASPPPAVPPA